MIESPTLSTILIAVGTSVASSFSTWIFSKKKYQADTESTNIDNMQKTLQFYQDICNDNKLRLDEQQKSNSILEQNIAELKSDNAVLKAENAELKAIVLNQTKLIEALNNKISQFEILLNNKKDITPSNTKAKKVKQ